MGWTFLHGASKADVIRELTRDYAREDGGYTKTLKKCVRGNVLYAVCEHKAGAEAKAERFIMVALLESSNGNWGFKDMDESMGPYHYGCPIGYLDLCTEPMNEEAARWREKVRTYHARRNRKLAIGDAVKLTNGWTVTITGLKPLCCTYEGRTYKLPRRMLAAAQEAA